MSDDERYAQPPAEADGATIGSAPTAAAGLPAVFESTRRIWTIGPMRGIKAMLKVNQKNGFDCQSCAWPSPDRDRHIAEFCENGAKAVASEATPRHAGPEFFRQWSIHELAAQSDHWLEQQGRLTHPMWRRHGSRHYEPIGWDDAIGLIAGELNALDSPDQAAFYTSGRTSNEAAFLYQLFVRQFGTNNLPDCSNMCHESSGAAMTESIGVGKTTVTLDDFDRADTIFIIGQNPGTNHPRMLTSLERAKRNGATIVAINPLAEVGFLRVKNPNPEEYRNLLTYLPTMLGDGIQLADLHLPVRINGDVALLKGIMKAMLEAPAGQDTGVDRDFIGAFTTGFDSFAADLAATPWSEIVEGSGIAEDDIRSAAAIVLSARRLICCWAMGLTQHRNAVDTIQEVMNLLLLGGHIGRDGAGACCVRGHSNVQGDRTMGISERMPAWFREALGREFGFTPPQRSGHDVVGALTAMHQGSVKVFFALGGNLLSAAPDTGYTAEAMRACRVTAYVSTKLNRAHLVTGEQALILPCLGRSERDRRGGTEQFVTVEDSMCVINASRGLLEPASPELRSEPAIVAALAAATLGRRSTVDWTGLADDYDRIRDHISRVVPGFERFNERIRADVFTLPNPARSREFRTASGRAQFLVHAIPRHDLAAGEFLLTSIRSHDQFNTTIYGLDDRYRGVFGGRRVVFLNRDDIEQEGWRANDEVDLSTQPDGGQHDRPERVARRFRIVPYAIPRRCAAAYFPEANVLVPIDSVARTSNTPASKSVRIRIRPTVSAD